MAVLKRRRDEISTAGGNVRLACRAVDGVDPATLTTRSARGAKAKARARTSEVLLPLLLDKAFETLQPNSGGSGEGEGSGADGGEGGQKPSGVADYADADMVLLDLLHAPLGSFLASLASVFARVEQLAHVLAWARCPGGDDDDAAAAAAKADGSTLALKLLGGIPHALLLEHGSTGELQVPAFFPVRPSIGNYPFSTELVLDRDQKWLDEIDNPYYVYKIHVSLSFLSASTLASALYLLLLRFLHRDYEMVVSLVDTVSSDTPMSKEEKAILSHLHSNRHDIDHHPDAHACRLKISFVMDSVLD
ncbi:hypothetical protein T492DRAFT_896684 [Pavlovales sp. CCMP2436]|nr:hypothetical protein T492DRAFT_896684 [Pavlovales sp. CCMP2436]